MRRMYSKKQLEDLATLQAEEVFEDKIDDAEIETSQLKDSSENNGKVLKVNATGGIEPTDSIDIASVKADEIIENMSGYVFEKGANAAVNITFADACKTGNKITFVICGKLRNDAGFSVGDAITLGTFTIPSSVGEKLIPNISTDRIGYKGIKLCINYYQGVDCVCFLTKNSDTSIYFSVGFGDNLSGGTDYFFRFEETYLLSDSLYQP